MLSSSNTYQIIISLSLVSSLSLS